VAAAHALVHPAEAATSPPCCKKCGGKAPVQHAPAAPKPADPSKPVGPDNCPCPLCAAPAAALFDALPATALDPPVVGLLHPTSAATSLDGFRSQPDRPPRAWSRLTPL
jgi:hypothetical protein